MKKLSFPLLILAALVIGIVGAQVFRIGAGAAAGTAPVPAAFDHTGPGLAEALRLGTDNNRLVVALATADWCGPCQSYKRGALADERVTDWLRQNAVTAYIDTDRSPGDAATLGITSIPTTVFFRDGREVARFTGGPGADTLLTRLEDAAR